MWIAADGRPGMSYNNNNYRKRFQPYSGDEIRYFVRYTTRRFGHLPLDKTVNPTELEKTFNGQNPLGDK